MHNDINEELIRLYVELHNMFHGVTHSELENHVNGNSSEIINGKLGACICIVADMLDKVNNKKFKLLRRAYPFDMKVSDVKDMLTNLK